ncbi:MAG: penicillin-binding protein activator LpoB [Phycisphaeraceae bacterium]|nr:penicillin-binding protein activator LpoB [Phycisphaeraceae bacterium]
MRTILLSLALVSSLLLLTGCSSSKAHRIESGGDESVTSLNKIDIQDWMEAADSMTQSLIESGILDQAATAEGPPVIAISRIVNSTTQQIDTDMLTKKIRVTLNQSGRAMTTTTIGLGGRAEDPLAKGEGQRAEFFNDGDNPQVKQARPRFTLSGKIIEDRARAGSTQQVTYVFQLSMTDVQRGLAAWEDERSITKQGKKNAVGW